MLNKNKKDKNEEADQSKKTEDVKAKVDTKAETVPSTKAAQASTTSADNLMVRRPGESSSAFKRRLDHLKKAKAS